jgi:hypothetical protein
MYFLFEVVAIVILAVMELRTVSKFPEEKV